MNEVKTFGKRLFQPVVPALLMALLSGCGEQHATNTQTATGYVAITETECAATGINGKWELVNIREAGKNTKPQRGQMLSISDCSHATYSSGNSANRSDAFKMFRVIQYCADFQLVYRNDSISCINIRKDTLIIGACNDYEDTRYYYSRR